MDNEQTNLIDDLMSQLGTTSAALEIAASGSKERQIEAAIYDQQVKIVTDYDREVFRESLEADKFETNKQNEQDRIAIEKAESEHRMLMEEKRLDMEREFKEAQLKVDQSKAKTEKLTLWSKVGLAAIEITSGIGLGVLYLKANMKYGGMMGRDAKEWFKDLKKVKL